MAQRRNPPKRPSRPARQPRAPKPSGARVSGSVNVSPKASFTLFGGSLLNLNFGGGRGRGGGRGGGGRWRRAVGFIGQGMRGLQGKDVTRGKITAEEKGRTFDEFRRQRPDLFQTEAEADVQVELDRVEVDQDDEGTRADRDDGQHYVCPRCKGGVADCAACGGVGYYRRGGA